MHFWGTKALRNGSIRRATNLYAATGRLPPAMKQAAVWQAHDIIKNTESSFDIKHTAEGRLVSRFRY
jgi:hypothetical protein